jgi:hypothetical protein
MRFPPPSAPVAAVPRAAPSTLPLSLASRHNLEERQQQLQSRVVAQKGSTLAGTSPAASSTTPPPLLSGAWAGADFIMLEVIDMLGKLRWVVDHRSSSTTQAWQWHGMAWAGAPASCPVQWIDQHLFCKQGGTGVGLGTCMFDENRSLCFHHTITGLRQGCSTS